MLLDGINHVAVLTGDIDRLTAFYAEVFDATHDVLDGPPGGRMHLIYVGHGAELNVFQMPDNDEHTRQTPMFGRGRLDHLALQAGSIEAFDEIRSRLMARGAADDFVTDFGHVLSLFFRDPDGLECEVCVANPDAVPGVFHGPGRRAARYPAEEPTPDAPTLDEPPRGPLVP